MPELDRRRFLAGAGAATVAPALSRLPLGGVGRQAEAPFTWGVASFDPTAGSVLLWTRVEPPPDGSAVALRWTVARDEQLAEVVGRGEVEATAERGHCVRAEVEGLPSASALWYRFDVAGGGAASPVGRTRTLPEDAAGLRLGVVACSRYAAGGFAAYRALAGRELDLVVHVGDYIYEDGAAEVRRHQPPHSLVDLQDYRARYAQHRADPDLQALHARHPMVAVWDDHEIAGNAWHGGAPSHDEAADGPWSERVRAASRAHDEWLPGRTGWGEDGRLKAWRSLALGGLAELVVLDTRLWGRDRQASTPGELRAGAQTRSLLGTDQAAFVGERLRRPDRPPWVLLANQVMFHPLRVPAPPPVADAVESAGFLVVDGEAVNPDQWDGYAGAREEVSVAMGGRGGVVVLTGDVHSSWAWEGPANDGGRPAMVELVTPSVSSGSFAERLPVPGSVVEPALRGLSDELAYLELASHGYLLVDLNAERVQAEWWYVDPADPGSQRFAAARSSSRGVPMRLSEVSEPSRDPTPATPPPEPTGGDDPPFGLIAAGTAALAALAGAAVALRTRRT